MKICFLHYSFKKDGVTRTVLNNILGLREKNKNLEFVLAGEFFSDALPDYIEKRLVNWNAENLLSEIEKVSSDSDILIIENPVVGILPKATLAFKNFAESTNKKIIYRIHDLIDDRQHLLEEFKKVFPNTEDIYPKSDNVCFITPNSFDKERLIAKGLKKVHVLPNSIIESDLYSSEENALRLRKKFEDAGIVRPGEKIISYPVRVLRRKNIEEAILITKLINNFGGNYRLVVTLPHEDAYQEEIEALAQEHNVQCSIGKAHRFLDYDKTEKFTTADLFSISDLVISTSIGEGFGFAFIEPWVAGIPLIGRNIPETTKDFEEAGIDLSPLYDNYVLHNSKIPEERMQKVKNFLSNEKELQKLQDSLNLHERIKKSSELIEKNREAVIRNYNHVTVADKFLNHINSILGNHN